MKTEQHLRCLPGAAIALALLVGSAVLTPATAADTLPPPKPYRFSKTFVWQQPNAKVLPSGNLAWAPEAFVFEHGDSIRYIDFERGNDGNDGTSKASPWKHHPWDGNATGKAKACSGIHTYVFKGGVEYRGSLTVKESGEPGNPIRLTRDPSWGEGNPIFHGATTIKGGWQKANASAAPGIPEPEKVWYIDLGMDYDKDPGIHSVSTIWQVDGDSVAGDPVERLHIARSPNFDLSDPNRPFNNWPTFDKIDVKNKVFYSKTIKDLAGTGNDELNDVVIWATWPTLMGGGTPRETKAGQWDVDKGSIKGFYGDANSWNRMRQWNKFMIENAAALLDTEGEFFFARRGPHAGRLYLRPAGGVDPNTVVFEVAQTHRFITMENKSHISVSGIDFRFNDQHQGISNDNTRHNGSPAPCILAIGNIIGLTVKNNRFHNVADAVEVRLRRGNRGSSEGQVLDQIVINDNDIRHASGAGVIGIIGPDTHGIWKDKNFGYGHVKYVEVKRNNIYHTGYRGGTRRWDSFPAVTVSYPETCEISGNIVRNTMGIGIITYGGKSSGFAQRTVPLVRYLIHHNQLDDTMLEANDYGGLEHFQGGPTYIYNNVSRNCNGNRSFWGHQLGYNLYLDGGFKCYSFNNILAGDVRPEESDFYSHCGYFMVFGFMDQFFNNTIYRFENGIDGSSGNRSNVIGNLITDCHNAFIRQNRSGDHSMLGGGDTGEMGRQGIPTMAYDFNLFHGSPSEIGEVAGTAQAGQRKAPVVKGATMDELRKALADNQCRLSGVGQLVDQQPMKDPAGKDYRPAIKPEAKGRGVKYFVPWALARMVGEWNFYKSEAAPQLVLGEHFYMTDEYRGRGDYYHLPRMDLVVADCEPGDYVSGELEDWIDGALSFDGERTAVLTNAEMRRDGSYSGGRGKPRVSYDGTKRETVDMDANDFMIEIVCHTEAGHTGGSLVAKSDSGTGYQLAVAGNGGAELTLRASGAEVTAASNVRINDGRWHHILAEVDRAAGRITLYVDGQPAGTSRLGLAKDVSLANSADFVVGEGFVGAIDFLRVARSTLAESKTDIDELYTWQYDGPHLRDFTGRKPTGLRSAGAITE